MRTLNSGAGIFMLCIHNYKFCQSNEREYGRLNRKRKKAWGGERGKERKGKIKEEEGKGRWANHFWNSNSLDYYT